MNNLRKLQEAFSATVFDGVDCDFSAQLTNTAINGKRRLQIYHNNVYTNLTAALQAVYPVIHRLVGDEFFNFAADDYIKRHPSRSGNLHDFGSQFAAFLESFKPASALEYLGDVARLEWTYHHVFHAADSRQFDLAKLQLIKKDEYYKLKFIANPASGLLYSPYPVLKIWQANRDDSCQDDSETGVTNTIRLDEGETRLLVVRKNLDIEIQILDTDEYEFLRAIYHGKQFFQACDAATRANQASEISQLLLKHIQNQTLIDCEISSNQAVS